MDRMTPAESDGLPATPEARGEPDADPRPFWMLRRKVTIPGRVADYMDRERLSRWAAPTRSRLTVVLAPGGFGKTTLLAECCRRMRARGVVTAWVSVDPSDERDVLDACIAFAFQCAGLNAGSPAGGDGGPGSRVGLLVRALEDRRESFVLAFDDLHQLADRGALELLEFLLRRGPPNLHLAAACRRLPAGLNIGEAALNQEASVIAAEDLRFTGAEIAEFFDRRLSRRELATVAAESAGWPMALRIRRNQEHVAPRRDSARVRTFVENWVESRLWEGIEPDDRELLLDVGLFERMDAALLDEVLGGNDAMDRLEAMEAMAGLLEPVRGDGRDALRLHPLIREHCVRQRFRHARPRFRELHRRIALALARRGETLAAMRHASRSGQVAPAGDILEDAGAVRLWISHGATQLQAAVALVDREVLVARPRLRLAHCAALVFSGHLEDARRTWRTRAQGSSTGPAVADEAERERWVDECIVRSILAMYGGESVGSQEGRAVSAELREIAGLASAEPLVRGYAEHGLCVFHGAKAEFDAAQAHGERALARFGRSRYARMMVAFQIGQIAMARGRVDTACKRYRSAMRIAKDHFVRDPAPVAIASVLMEELEHERGRRLPSRDPPGIPAALVRHGTPSPAYAAASGVSIARALTGEGAVHALAAVEEMLDYVRGAGLPAPARYLAALRVSLLVDAGRPGDAEQAWRGREGELPSDAQACLDLEGQSWREMEALSCAWLRLCIARERFAEARTFAAALCSAAADRGLRRTRMRTLTQCVVLERRAGDEAAAGAHLAEFLELFAETDYAGSAVLERRACAPALDRFLEETGESRLRAPARALRAALRAADADALPLPLSARETQVLHRLGTQPDKAIAAELGLTPYGVRYHIRNLFTRLGAHSRAEAVRRARELGLLPGEE